VRQLLSEIFLPVNVQFKQIIGQHILTPLSMDQLAYICNMSLSTFKREFKKTFDDTPARYIKHKRLEHAANLLVYSQDAISVIAYDSGFQDVTTFSHSFHKYFNQTPSQYRLAQTRK